MTDSHFDQLETREPIARERALFNLLPGLLARAVALAPGWAEHLKGIDLATINSRAALASLPLLKKSALKDLQAKQPPFGGFATDTAGVMGRIMMSPGPIFEPEGRGEDWWRSARALFAAGVRRGDIVHNTFAYHLTPGGWILDAGARALGCAVIAAGPGNTEQQLEAIAHLKPNIYVGVPDYLKILLDKAKETGKDASSIKRALVSGGALFPSLRAEYKARGVAMAQCYATADLGIIAYESSGPDGILDGMIVDEGAIVEIVRPGTGDPVPHGEVGEMSSPPSTATIRCSGWRPATYRLSCRACRRVVAPICAFAVGSAAPIRRPRSRACSCIPNKSPNSPSSIQNLAVFALSSGATASRTP